MSTSPLSCITQVCWATTYNPRQPRKPVCSLFPVQKCCILQCCSSSRCPLPALTYHIHHQYGSSHRAKGHRVQFLGQRPSPEDWSPKFLTFLILIQCGHHHEVHCTHPRPQKERRVLQGAFSFYLRIMEIKIYAFRGTVTFITENSFDLSLNSANSDSD